MAIIENTTTATKPAIRSTTVTAPPTTGEGQPRDLSVKFDPAGNVILEQSPGLRELDTILEGPLAGRRTTELFDYNESLGRYVPKSDEIRRLLAEYNSPETVGTPWVGPVTGNEPTWAGAPGALDSGKLSADGSNVRQFTEGYPTLPSTARPYEAYQPAIGLMVEEAIKQFTSGQQPQYFPGMEGYTEATGKTQPPTLAPQPTAVTESQQARKDLAAPGGGLDVLATTTEDLFKSLTGGTTGLAKTAGAVQGATTDTLKAVGLPEGGVAPTVTAPTVTAPTVAAPTAPGVQAVAPTVQAGAIDTSGAQAVTPTVAAPQITTGVKEVLSPALQQMLSGQADLSQVQAVTEAATRPLVEQFQRNIVPRIGHEAVAAGQAGGSKRGVAEGIAAGELEKQIGDIGTQVAYRAYQDALAQQQAGASTAAGLVGQEAGLGLEAGKFSVDAATRLRAMDIDVSKADASNKLAAALKTGELQGDTLRVLADIAKTQAGFDLNAAITNGEFDLAGQKLAETIRSGITGEALEGAKIGAGLQEADVNTLLKSIGLSPTVAQSLLTPSQVQSEVGAEEFAYDQTVINEAMKEWNFDETAPQRSLMQLAGAITGFPNGVDPAIYEQQGYSTSDAQKLARAGGVGLGTWAMLTQAAIPGAGWIAAGATVLTYLAEE